MYQEFGGTLKNLLHTQLLSECSIASSIWNHFSTVFGVSLPVVVGWRECLIIWWTLFGGLDKSHLLAQLVPILTVWELWLNRNAARFDAKVKSTSMVTGKVKR